MSLKDDKQQNIQKPLDFPDALTGEARETGREETDSPSASGNERPARTDRLKEEIIFDQVDLLIKLWPKRSSTSRRVMVGSSISIWRNSSIESNTTN